MMRQDDDLQLGADVAQHAERRSGPVVMKGEAYLKHHALPNFFFHATTAYAILRAQGVNLGKRDFMGTPRVKR